MITYNGNEMMLQNDMGNTLILDSATGNIMGLSEGFIPIGLKEHGGIMYIASVNKDGYGEIGTIPSPIIRDIYKDKIFYNVDKSIPIGVGDPITITNKLYPADKFIANLLMGIEESLLKGIKYKKLSQSGNEASDPCNIILGRECLILTSVEPDPDSGLSGNFGQAASTTFTTIYSPVISYASDSNSKIEIEGGRNINVQKKGIYNLNLYSTSELGKNHLAGESLLSSQMYNEGTSQYWFLHTDDPLEHFPKDLFNATLNKSLKQVPVSSKPGRLAVKLIPETIKTFGMLPRQEEPFNTPITYKKDGLYYTFFPGFYYSTDNGLYVETIDAKVIDESTNQEMELVYPFGSNKPFSRYDLNGLASKILLGSLFTGKLWAPNNDGFPHTLSSVQEAEYKTFILSPIAGIYDHTKTNFKSSTEAENEHPHAGLFYAKLGDKYNNWYRLEVTYKDLYDGNEGTFTTRFNPYLNDVFGTNLCVVNTEKSGFLKMGLDITPGSKNLTLTVQNPKTNISYKTRSLLSIDIAGSGKLPLVTQIYSHFYSNDVEFKIQHDEHQTFCIDYNYSGSPIPELNAEYKYIYNLEISYTDKIQEEIDNCFLTKNYYLGFGYKNDIPTEFDFKDLRNTDCKLIAYPEKVIVYDSELVTIPITGSNDTPHTLLAFNFNNVRTQFSDSGKDHDFSNDSVMFITTYKKNPSEPMITSRKLNADVATSINELIKIDSLLPILSGSVVLKMELPNKIIGNFYRINKGYPALGQNEDREDFGSNTPLKQYNWTIGLYPGTNSTYNVFRVRAELNYPELILITRTYNSVAPSYSITPYFLLQGQNDSGKTVCVQRFNGMTYEHNLTEVSIEQLTESSLESKPCSYNEQNPFKYYTSEVLEKTIALEEPGLYVLNIQRCPGVSNWTQNGTTPLVNLKIKTEDVEKLIENWSFTGIDSNGYEYEEHKGVDTSNMRAYVPIVIYVPKAGVITISIKGQKIGDVVYTFNRQSMGLYKLNITDERFGEDKETLNKLFSDGVFLYKDYMNKVYDHAVTTYQEDKVKQYNFIQTYGAFFKEAFVFVDGLLDEENKSVNSVTIGDKTYRPYPYIPNDSSILPFGYNNGKYIWNTYYMTKEVLDGGGTFKFSNASPNDISTTNLLKSLESITGDNSLRQLITQSEE